MSEECWGVIESVHQLPLDRRHVPVLIAAAGYNNRFLKARDWLHGLDFS